MTFSRTDSNLMYPFFPLDQLGPIQLNFPTPMTPRSTLPRALQLRYPATPVDPVERFENGSLGIPKRDPVLLRIRVMGLLPAAMGCGRLGNFD